MDVKKYEKKKKEKSFNMTKYFVSKIKIVL
mgnify:CR=1 FL=1